MRASSEGQITRHLLDVIDVLEKLSIPVLTIGAVAAAAHGSIRATQDADALIWIGANPDMDIAILLPTLQNCGWTVEYRSPDEFDEVRGVIEVRDKFNNSADLLLGIRRMSRDAFQRGKRVKFEDGYLPVVGVEDFIAMKLTAGSRKDIDDAEVCYSVNKSIVDENLLTTLASSFGAETAKKLEELRSRV